MVQVLTGVTKGEAVRTVKVGESLIGTVDDSVAGEGDVVEPGSAAEAPATPWYEPLRAALLDGRITQAQYDVILRGLGAPVVRAGMDADTVAAAWSAAAEQLIVEAAVYTVEVLRDQARTLRDLLDDEGAQERLRAAFEARSFRVWRGADGLQHGAIVFDPEAGEWADSVISAALRPRRGGPRFVSEHERASAEELVEDPRTNEQLAYDLFLDLLRAGVGAEAKDVCGTREPGVRMVVVKDAVTGEAAQRDAFGRLIAVGHTEDGRTTFDGGTIERALCLGGAVEVAVDNCGKPLDVGREERLFTPKQRLALAVRDGGCMWPGCDRPASMCEAHHVVPWSQGGRTDIDDGILLCRFHHLWLHFHGWAIERAGHGRFLLMSPPQVGDAAGRADTIVLTSKSALRWLWDPPPERVGWRTVPAPPGA